jgi:hypothetical protein
VAELDAQSGIDPGGKPRPFRRVKETTGWSGGSHPMEVAGFDRGDFGGASRFFATFPADLPDDACRFNRHPICDLCGLTFDAEIDTISWEQQSQETTRCQPATSAVPSSSPADITTGNGSALGPVQAGPLPDCEGREPSEPMPVASAADHSRTSKETTGSTAPIDAATRLNGEIARAARSAASLCGPCATDFARNLAAVRRGRSPEQLPGWASISGPNAPILSRSLALLAESLGSTDTIPTTASLKLWFGFARDAISTNTTPGNVDTSDGSGPQSLPGFPENQCRYIYCAKASRRDRNEGCEGMRTGSLGEHDGRQACLNSPGRLGITGEPINGDGRAKLQGNHHPTVKPTDLMSWLVRLITPPGGLVLDPFAGSGSTGKAAAIEGFRFLGIEREAEYVEIARARIAAVFAATPLFRDEDAADA